MKQKFLLLISLVLIAVQGWALPVDESSAREIVQDFVIQKRGFNPNSVPTAGGNTVQLLHAEMSNISVTQNAYYIYSTGDGFVIVAGDDRAEQILGYGDGDFDMNDIPCGLKAMLDSYKEQIDYLFEHPGLVVETPSMNAPRLSATSVAPLLTAKWSQGKPYYNLVPTYNGSHCRAGCSSIALGQVMHYWQYPTINVPSVREYTTRTHHIYMPALPSDRFHWNYIKDSYKGSYTDDEAYSVAKLIKYVGQAMEMDYSPDGSGNYRSIRDAAVLLGYDHNAKVLFKDSDNYTDAEWAALIQAELFARRPVVMTAISTAASAAHAFVIDGYNATQNKYHINWGWGGSGNDYYALNAFNVSNYKFNAAQAIIIGLKPQSSPEIEISPTSRSFYCPAGGSGSVYFSVKGYALTGDLTVKLNNGSNIYSIDKNTITKDDAAYEALLYVTYKPTEVGTSNASVTFSGGGATAKTIPFSCTAYAVSTINVNPSSLSFNSVVGETKTATFTVKCPNAIGNLSLKLNNGGNIYSIDKTSISKNNAINGTTVTVTYSPTIVGTSSASITISGGGANPITVPLSGTAIKPEITVTPSSLSFNAITGETKTATFTVKCAKAKGDLNITLNNGGNAYFIDKTNITKSEAINGTSVTVTYCPTEAGTSSASVIVSGGGADPKTVKLSGTAIKPEITVTPSTLSFSAYTGDTKTATFTVKCSFATEDLILQLNNGGTVYSIDKTSISKSDAINGTSVTVTYSPTDIGTSNASVTVSGGGAEPKTISLNGSAIAEIWVSPASINFVSMYNNIHVGDTIKRSFNVNGKGLTGDLTICLNDDSGNYSIDKTSISMSEAVSGPVVTVTYAPTEAGTSNASVTVSGGGAEPKTVTISGTAVKPEITVDPSSLSFVACPGETVTRSFIVTGNYLAAGLRLSLNDDSGIFSIDKRSIGRSDAANGDTVTVTYSPTEVGTSSAYVTISGGGYGNLIDADPVTVILSGTAADPFISVNTELMSFNTYTGHPLSKTFTVSGTILSDLSLALNDSSGAYSIDKTIITPAEASGSASVTVTYNPTADGSHNASITISGGGAEAKTVALEGCAVSPGIPEITTDASAVTFDPTYTGYESYRTILITATNVLSDLQLSLSPNNNSFALSKHTIKAEQAAAGVPVTVYFYPTSGGTKQATLNIVSDGAETVSIPVSGVGIKSDGYITAWPTNLSFETQVGTPVTQTFKVTYSYPNGSIMISSVDNGGVTGSDDEGGVENSMLSLNALDDLSNLPKTHIQFDSIYLRRKDFIGPIVPVLYKCLVLTLTGDDCFDITPSRIRLLRVPYSDYVTVTYYPDCVGNHDATLTISLIGGSARPLTLTLHGTATDQLNAPSCENEGNDLMITHNGTGINALVNEVLMNAKVYAEGQNIIIESPVEQSAIISDISGRARSVNLQAGRNEIPVNSSGIYIVRIREKTTKLMLK